MLNGVGGRTVEEAKSHMTYREFVSWAQYVQKRGPLNSGHRLEKMLASMLVQFANIHWKKTSGGRFALDDFMLHGSEADKPETAQTPEQVMAALTMAFQSGHTDGN